MERKKKKMVGQQKAVETDIQWAIASRGFFLCCFFCLSWVSYATRSVEGGARRKLKMKEILQ